MVGVVGVFHETCLFTDSRLAHYAFNVFQPREGAGFFDLFLNSEKCRRKPITAKVQFDS